MTGGSAAGGLIMGSIIILAKTSSIFPPTYRLRMTVSPIDRFKSGMTRPTCPASPEFKGKSAHGTYGNFVQEMDYRVGQVLQALEELHLLENTLVIFTSDNGPLPSALPSGHSCTAGLRGIKTTGWDGGLKVLYGN